MLISIPCALCAARPLYNRTMLLLPGNHPVELQAITTYLFWNSLQIVFKGFVCWSSSSASTGSLLVRDMLVPWYSVPWSIYSFRVDTSRRRCHSHSPNNENTDDRRRRRRPLSQSGFNNRRSWTNDQIRLTWVWMGVLCLSRKSDNNARRKRDGQRALGGWKGSLCLPKITAIWRFLRLSFFGG